MKYLKLYEDFNSNGVNIKDLLEDISSLDYILSDEGIKAKYFVTEKMASDAPNTYMIGTSDDISTKVDESFDGVGIYKIKIYFDTSEEMKDILFEYYNKLKNNIEEIYNVHVVKDEQYTQTTGYIWGYEAGAIKSKVGGKIVKNCVSVIVERQPDDYVYFEDEDEDEDINESVDDETAMKHYGLYPEDVKEMFYDLQDLDIFPEKLRVFVEFKSMLGQGDLMSNVPMSNKVMQFQHFPYIEVRVKSDAISVPEYGKTQADRNMIQSLLTKMTEDERFKEVIEVANNRLEDYDWKIEQTYKDFSNDYIRIIIKKI